MSMFSALHALVRRLAMPSVSRDEAQQQAMLEALNRPGCPVCRPLPEAQRKYFFWFVTESYASAETFQHLVRARGFCPAHSARLTALSEGDSHAVAAAYQRLLTHFADRIAGKARERRGGIFPASSARCPACATAESAARRQLDTLAATLHDGGIESYRDPALLCGAHLKQLLPRLEATSVAPLLERHRQRLLTLLNGVTDNEQLEAILCVQSQQAGYPSDGAAADRAEEEAVAAFAGRLGGTAECPVCVSQRHAWHEWAAWLERAAVERIELDKWLPLCVTHMRALAASASPALRARALAYGHESVCRDVEAGLKVLHKPSSPPRNRRQAVRRSLERLPWRRRRRYRRRVARAVHRVCEPSHCPLCERLAEAQKQSLRLLLTLLREPHHRDRYRRGHGLCLPHLEAALALRGVPVVRETLHESCLTALELIGWELTQVERKQRWDNRPERKGREEDAWRRALRRLSGSLLAPEARVERLDLRNGRMDDAAAGTVAGCVHGHEEQA